MKAFLKVGKPVSFPLDLPQYLPSINRTEALVTEAEAKLTLPKDLILYAQFWFVKATPLDDIAFNHLFAGEITKAEEIWEKKESFSSLQNRIVCALIQKDYARAVSCAETLYSSYISQLVFAIIGNNGNHDTSSLAFSFLDVLCDDIGAHKLISLITNNDWKKHIREKAIKRLIDNIQDAIGVAQRSKEKDLNARLESGETLMSCTKDMLSELETYLPTSDMRYQMIADKLGLEILQCSIDYYNDSEEEEAAYKAIILLRYAHSIVMGEMAMDKCKKIVDIMEKIVKHLPPIEVLPQHKAIRARLASFALELERIEYSIKLLKDCAPYLVAIKEQLGNSHSYYLSISTKIVNNALENVISEVNKAQKNNDFRVLKATLIAAWRTQLYMDKFDLEPEYKANRFKQQRETLFDIIEKCKGFEDKSHSFMYHYGCGWCNNLGDDEVDLRTDDELYVFCQNHGNLSDYKTYVKRFPVGKHIAQANEKIETLTFKNARTIANFKAYIRNFPTGKYVAQAEEKIETLSFKNAKTIADFEQFISEFPNSNLVVEAQASISKLIKEENERKERIARQEKAIAACHSTNEVLDLFTKERENKIDVKQCSLKAYELAKTKEDYQQILSVFHGTNTEGVIKAKAKIEEIEEQEMEMENREDKIPKWILWIPTLIIVFAILWKIRTSSDTYSDIYNETDSIATQDSTLDSTKTHTDIEYKTYINNQLKTGEKPYKSYYRSHVGHNRLEFNTSGDDYVIIVRDYETSKVVNHIYVRAGDRGRLYLPNGLYDIYFYSGKGWNPNKKNGNVVGGFVSDESIQKDGPIKLYNEYGEYTLYPVQNGNLQLENATADEAL